MGPLPELRAVISSTAAVGSGVCRDSLHFFIHLSPWSLQGGAPLTPRGGA